MQSGSAPAALRVYAWRLLRSLGAIYLHQSVCALPARVEVTDAVEALAERARRDGGQVRILRVVLDDPAEEARLIAEFQAGREDEYREVVARAPQFLEELAQERDRARMTYPEVEESEADLQRFRTWLAKIESRDWFDAPGRIEARAAVERCAVELAAFEQQALQAEMGAPDHVAPSDPPS